MLWKSIILLLIGLQAYLLFGACVFHFLEEPHETHLKDTTKQAHFWFLSNHSCIPMQELEEFVLAVLDAKERGVVSTPNTTSQSNWDFFSSYFFSSTVVTTIGYGNIAPNTLGGQIFCTFYTLVGIPLSTVFLASLGQKLMCPMNNVCERMKFKRSKRMDKCIKVLFSFVCGTTFFILLPSVMFSLVEDWTYGVSIYYSVITLTTVGLGDYVAGMKPVPLRSLYRFVGAVWVVLGLTWVALFVSQAVTDLENKIAKEEEKLADNHSKGRESDAKVSIQLNENVKT